MSVYRGISVPSVLFDSVGSKKIEAFVGYIIEALKNGKILIIDELDSSLHFKLTRAIVAMFNNDSNNRAQLIF
jgi:AAA15 family ATPase/GTPase